MSVAERSWVERENGQIRSCVEQEAGDQSCRDISKGKAVQMPFANQTSPVFSRARSIVSNGSLALTSVECVRNVMLHTGDSAVEALRAQHAME